jgi:23S rRNA (uracil1939-C5)-methyltransferase
VPPDAPEIDCEHAARCGGCALIGLPYPAQLAAKAQRLANALAPYGLAPPCECVRAAVRRAAYRTRAKLVVGPGGAIGLYARGGHELVDVPGCRVLPPELAAVAAALRGILPGAGVDVRAVDLRAAAGDGAPAVLVDLVVAGPVRGDEPNLQALADRVAALPGVAGVAASARAPGAPRVLGGEPRVLRGPAGVPDRLGPDLPWSLAAHGAFVQAHREQARALQDALVGELRGALGDLRGARVVELFAGSGSLVLRLAAEGARPLGVESQARAAEAARSAARAQGLAVELERGDATRAAARLAATSERPDAVVVNPPRRGLPPALRAALARLAPRVLVYVSCEPPTLARDLAHLAWLGWRAERLAPFDLIPQSEEVETLARLAPAPPPVPRLLHEDEALLVFEKPPHVPTTPHPEQPASLVERVRAAFPDAAPAHRLDAGTSGACLFARTPAGVADAARALAGGRKEYLCLARGITRPKGVVSRPLVEQGRPREARTRYRRLAVVGGHSLVAVEPEHGRTHQIRRHLAALGHPVLGDLRHGHGPSNRHLFERHGLDRPFLHCASLAVARPGGAPLRIASALAPDLRAVLASLGGAPPGEFAPPVAAR